MAEIASVGFPPIAGTDARVLVLGSLPGARSIQAQQYYAHPRNAFWQIMQALFSIQGSYEARCAQLIANRIALWDVLASSVRPGSLDASIDISTAEANDLQAFCDEHRRLEIIAFNGRKAEALYRRFARIESFKTDASLVSLPSTSPAYAAMPFSVKLSAWREALEHGE